MQSALSPELPRLEFGASGSVGDSAVLRRTEGNISAAARLVDLARDTFGLKMKKYGISKDERRTDGTPGFRRRRWVLPLAA